MNFQFVISVVFLECFFCRNARNSLIDIALASIMSDEM